MFMKKETKHINYRNQIEDLIRDSFIPLPDNYNFSSDRAFSYLNRCTSDIIKNYGQIVFILGTVFKIDTKEFSNWLENFHGFLSRNKIVLLKMEEHYATITHLTDPSKKIFCDYVDCINKKIGELSIMCSKALSEVKSNPVERSVFIVHGHDTKLRDSLKKSLIKRDYVPIVLSDMHDSGISLFDKFEKYANQCTKAVILMTSDDLIVKGNDKYFQGRPNVLIEYGYFLNMLDKRNIVVLLEKGCNKPSDIDGVSYIEYIPGSKNIVSKIISSLDSY